jgi:hypothetical protein
VWEHGALHSDIALSSSPRVIPFSSRVETDLNERMSDLAQGQAAYAEQSALLTIMQVRFCRCLFFATGDLGYKENQGRGGLGYRFTVLSIPLLLNIRVC